MANGKAPPTTGDCSKTLQGNCSQLLGPLQLQMKESVLGACSIHVLSAVFCTSCWLACVFEFSYLLKLLTLIRFIICCNEP